MFFTQFLTYYYNEKNISFIEHQFCYKKIRANILIIDEMYFINKQTVKIHPFLTINVIVTN